MFMTCSNEASLVASYCPFLFGLDISFSADVANLIPSKTITIAEKSFIGSINLYARAFSSLGTGYLANRIGRKNSLVVSMLLNLSAWTIMVFFANNIHTVYLCRLFSGLASGMRPATMLYISEISHKNRRGKLLAISGLLTSFGTALTYVIQYFFSPKMVALVAFIVSLIATIQSYFLLETKYYLLMKNDMQQAQISMLWFNNTMSLDDINQEITEIQGQQQKVKRGSRKPMWKIFQQASNVKSFVICFFILSFRITAGSTAISAHPQLFFSLFLLPLNTQNMTLIQGVVEIIFSLINVLLADEFPRKFLLQWCCWIMNFCLICAFFQYVLVERFNVLGEWIILVIVIVYAGSASGVLMNLTLICVSEIVSTNTEARAIIFSTAQFGEHILMAVYTNLFPFILTNMSLNFIILFKFLSLAVLSLMVYFIPETVGKVLHKCEWREKQQKQQNEPLLENTSESDISTVEDS